MEIKSKEIKLIDIDLLVENPKNNNRHSIEQIERLAKIIKHQGFRNPLTVSNRSGFVIAGHGRIEAARLLNMKVLPVIYQDFKDEAEEYLHMTADNEIARWAELDKHLVYEQIANFPDLDLELLGIEDFNIGDAGEIDLPELNSGDKGELEQITYTLHVSQMDTVKEAMALVKSKYKDAYVNELNENNNGNAIAYVCEMFITQNT